MDTQTIHSESKATTEDQYAYLCARIKSMKGLLLPAQDIKEIETYTRLSEFIDYLLNTDYAEHIRLAIVDVVGLEEVEKGINDIFITQLKKVIRLVKELAPMYEDIFVSEWDLHNTKALVRYIHMKSDQKLFKSSFIPVGNFDRDILEEAGSIETIEDLVKLLDRRNIPTEWPLARALLVYQKERRLLELENKLESQYYERLQACKKAHATPEGDDIITLLLSFALDVANMRIVLRFIKRQLGKEKARELFFPGEGRIKFDQFNALLECTTIDQVIDLLPNHPILSALQDGMLHFLNSGDPSIFERFFKRSDLKYKKALYIRNPLSIAVPIYFIELARNQMVNLRTLARGIYYKLPLGTLHEELIYV